MEFAVGRQPLSEGVAAVCSVVERRNSSEILNHVKVKAEKSEKGGAGKVSFITTDMSIFIKSDISATVITEGSCTMPVATLNELIRKMPSDTQVKFSRSGDAISIKIKGGSYVLPTLDADEFPSFELDSGSSSKFRVPADKLKKVLIQSRHAIANDDVRYYLNGAYMHGVQVSGGSTELCVAATDIHRLSKGQVTMKDGDTDLPGIILPKKSVGEVIKVLDNINGDVVVSISDSQAVFYVGNTTLATNLIDAKYPDYNKVIPSGNDKFIELDLAELVNTIGLVTSVIAEDDMRVVRFQINKGSLLLSSGSSVAGTSSGEHEMPVQYDGQPVTLGFNSKYLLDALNTIKEEKRVRFFFNEESNNTPVVIRSVNDSSSWLHLIMPVKI